MMLAALLKEVDTQYVTLQKITVLTMVFVVDLII
jgi:hypothetical protein